MNIRQEKLLEAITHYGMLTLNSNPISPNLIDLGYNWTDISLLIDSHLVFYSKAFQKRTTYLSVEIYYLMKKYKPQKAMCSSAQRIYDLLRSGMLDTIELKSLAFMKEKNYKKAFEFLLEQRYITAYSTRKALNPNWSTFLYCTSDAWEQNTKQINYQEYTIEDLNKLLANGIGQNNLKAFMK